MTDLETRYLELLAKHGDYTHPRVAEAGRALLADKETATRRYAVLFTALQQTAKDLETVAGHALEAGAVDIASIIDRAWWQLTWAMAVAEARRVGREGPTLGELEASLARMP